MGRVVALGLSLWMAAALAASSSAPPPLPAAEPAAKAKPGIAAPVSSGAASGGRVIAVAKQAVAVSPRIDRPWRLNDEVCVLRDELEIACGKVVKTLPRGAIVRLTRMDEPPYKGDRVVAGPGRAPTMMTSTVRVSAETRAFHLAAGALASPNYFVPTVQGSINIAGPLSLGIQAGYLTATTTNFAVSAIPVLGLMTYHSHGDFEGLWGQLALGTYFYSVTSTTLSESPMTLSAYLTLGYRFSLGSFLTVGLAGGGKYLPSPDSASVELDFSSIQPIGLMEVGVKF